MRRRGSSGGGGGGGGGGGPPSFDHHVSVNIQDATVRARGGLGSGAGAGAGVGSAPLETLLQEAGAGKHAEVLRYLKRTLDEEKREFSRLQQDVFDSLTEHEVMEASFDRQFEAQQTFGGQAADYVAAVGGSWRFVFFFAVFIAAWAALNTAVGPAAWDPYPYILLNLFLSCLASFQAPVIMMAQNRQVERDRGQSDYTARVNLRAELVTRHINAKLDAFISTAWRRLYESQAIQTSVVERLLELERQQLALVKALGRAQAQAHAARARAGSREDMDRGESGGGGGGGGLSAGASEGGLPSAVLAYRGFGRRMSDEVLESPAVPLGPGTVLQVYDEEGEEEEAETEEEEEGRKGDEETGEAAAVVAAATTADGGEEGEPRGPPVQRAASSSMIVQAPMSSLQAQSQGPPTALGIYATPLAALCVAPPAARGLRALDLPWLLETEEDPHTIFLMRTMLRAVAVAAMAAEALVHDGRVGDGGGGGGGGGLWEDAERMIFEHRSSSADNFVGSVSGVHIQSRDPSLATKGVICAFNTTTGSGGMHGRRVAPAFVSTVVEAASLVDTGGGAEPWFPFDVAYDLSFPGEGAALDSLLAGDAILTLRNALDLPFQTSMGEIRQMTLHPRGCPCSRLCAEAAGVGDGSGVGGSGSSSGGGNGSGSGSAINAPQVLPGAGGPSLSRAMSVCAGAIYVRQGEIPPRFKPSLSQDREDRISDFWKMPLSRVQISYSPAPIFACVTLRPGQAVVPLSVEFLSHPRNGAGGGGQQQHGGFGGGEITTTTPPLSRQGSGTGYGILSPLARAGSGVQAALVNPPVLQGGRSKSPMLPGEVIEPAPQQQQQQQQQQPPPPPTQPPVRSGTPTAASALAHAWDRAAQAGTATLNRNQSGSLKKVIELWHGRHHHHAAAGGGGGGGERSSTPDSTSTANATANPGAEGGGIEALLSASHHHLRAPPDDSGGGKELLVIINPAAESLCEALAHGHEWAVRRRSLRRRRRAREKGSGEGPPEEEEQQQQQQQEGRAEGDEVGDDENGPLSLDALPPEALNELPHNRWLALPLHKAGGGGGGAGRGPTATATYEIDMPLIPGPAVVFFYSPYGRLRLRGVLRDDGAEPILEDDLL